MLFRLSWVPLLALGVSAVRLRSYTDSQLRERTLELVARLRAFQAGADQGRDNVLDKTLPGRSDEARAAAFRRITTVLRDLHENVQKDFKAGFRGEALALQRELMARLGIAVRRDGIELAPLQYDAADYLEELAQRLPS